MHKRWHPISPHKVSLHLNPYSVRTHTLLITGADVKSRLSILPAMVHDNLIARSMWGAVHGGWRGTYRQVLPQRQGCRQVFHTHGTPHYSWSVISTCYQHIPLLISHRSNPTALFTRRMWIHCANDSCTRCKFIFFVLFDSLQGLFTRSVDTI